MRGELHVRTVASYRQVALVKHDVGIQHAHAHLRPVAELGFDDDMTIRCAVVARQQMVIGGGDVGDAALGEIDLPAVEFAQPLQISGSFDQAFDRCSMWPMGWRPT